MPGTVGGAEGIGGTGMSVPGAVSAGPRAGAVGPWSGRAASLCHDPPMHKWQLVMPERDEAGAPDKV
ncbi:hypothetical protein, partial [Streptomyces nigra]